MSKRFRVALSFAGQKRHFVAETAAILADRLGGRHKILYDKYHEAEFARTDLAFHLPALYHDDADLIVAVLCRDYRDREWCGLEWSAIYGLVKKGHVKEVMLCRFDRVEGKGLHGLAGFLDLDDKTPAEAAALILERLALNDRPAGPPANPDLDNRQMLLWLEQVADYEKASTQSFRSLPIADLCDSREIDYALTLSGLYVEPKVATYVAESFEQQQTEGNSDQALSPQGTATEGNGRAKSPTTVERASAVVELNSVHRQHVLLGDAGSGKSSVLRYIYLEWARKFAEELVAGRDGSQAGAAQILVEVREFLAARNRAAEGMDSRPIESPIDYLTNTCFRTWCFEKTDLLAALRNGRARLLIDGLDEALDPNARRLLSNWLLNLAQQYPTVSIIVSSRSIGFPLQNWWGRERRSEWQIHTLLPFDDAQIAMFLANWFRAATFGVGAGMNLRVELLEAIRRHDFLKGLSRSPLTLALLCAVGQRGIRPDNRAKLFAQACSVFIERWDDVRYLPDDKAEIVREFANFGEKGRVKFFRAVAEKMLIAGDPNESNQISREDLLKILLESFREAPNPGRLARGILDLICVRNFLLVEQPGDSFAFFHRSFLEYFTAFHWAKIWEDNPRLTAQEYFDQVFVQRWNDETWHETFRFLFALLENHQAVACLDLLADLPLWKQPRDCPGIERSDAPSEEKALTLAAELALEVRPPAQSTRASLSHSSPRQTPCEIVAGWKSRLWEFGFSTCYVEDLHGRALRRRALSAIATIWKHDAGMRDDLLRGEYKEDHFNPEHDDVGDALIVSWSGDGHAKATLLRAVIGEPSATGPDENTNVRARALRLLSKGWQGEVEVKAALLRVFIGVPPKVPPDHAANLRAQVAKILAESWPRDAEVKAAFLRAAVEDASPTLRTLAVEALSAGWQGDADARAVFLRLAIGLPPDVSADIDADVRGKAVVALAKHGAADTEVKTAWMRIAIGSPPDVSADSGHAVRYHAIDALATNWNGAEEVKAVLLRALVGVPPHVCPDASRGIRKKAVSALATAWTGDAEIKAALLRTLKDDTSSEVREEAVSALTKGWPTDPDVKEAFLAATVDVRPNSPAEETRGKRGPTFIGSVMAALFPAPTSPDGHSQVRWKVGRALREGWAGDPAVKAVFLRSAIGAPPDVPPNPYGEVRCQAIMGLGKGWAGDADAKAAILQVLGSLPLGLPPDEDSSVREEAVKSLALGWKRDEDAKAVLLRMVVGAAPDMRPEEDEEVREEALRALAEGWAGDEGAKTTLLLAATGAPPDVPPNPSDDVRSDGLDALAKGWPKDPEVKSACLRVLVGLPPDTAPDPSRAVRTKAIGLLAAHWSEDAEVKSTSLRILNGAPPDTHLDEESGVRSQAVKALVQGWAQDVEAKTALIRTAIGLPSNVPSDPDPYVRRQALNGLATGWREDSDTKAALLCLVIGAPPDVPADADYYVRKEALERLAEGWPGDLDTKAILLRVAIDISPDFLPKTHNYLRHKAVDLLGKGWRRDAEVRTALLRITIGQPPTVRPDPEPSVRAEAARALAEGWAKDTQLRATMRAVAADSSAQEEAREAAEQYLSQRVKCSLSS